MIPANTQIIGRRNYLFAGSDSGGERAAILYGLIGTARMNGLDPEAYLRYVLARVGEHPIKRIEELLRKRVVSPSGIFTGLGLTMWSWLTRRVLHVRSVDFGPWPRSSRS